MYNLKAQELFVPVQLKSTQWFLRKKIYKRLQTDVQKVIMQNKKKIAHFFCSGQQKNKKQKKTNKTKANKKQKII